MTIAVATLERAIKESLLEEAKTKPTGADTFASCMTCGRSVDRERAARLGHSARFCSGRCREAFDRGFDPRRGPAWMCAQVAKKEGMEQSPTPAFVTSGNPSARSKSEAQKERRRLEKKKALAEAWKKTKAKRKQEAA